MLKKIICTALSFVLAASLLSGCGAPAEEGSEGGSGTQDTSSGVPEGTDSDASGQAQENGEDESSGTSSEPADSGDGESEQPPILKDAVMDIMGCRIGCAATEGELKDEKVWEIITTHFNAITFGNELKPDAMWATAWGNAPARKRQS